jgi:hypothetical protein
MGTAISLFDTPTNNLPAHLAAFNSGVSTDLMLGGIGRNKIGFKGSRFRLIVNGQEESVLESLSMDVVIVGAAKGVGRIFFEGQYDPDTKVHPTCYSADGVAPGADVTNPQSVKCANCPQNEKGSKIANDGTKTKACNYFKRLAVVWLGDPQHRIFQIDAKAMSIFGDGEPARNLFTLNEYAKKLNTRGWDVAHLVTKLSFDTESSVPKVYFSPVRLLDETEAGWVQELVNSDEVLQTVTITAITDASDSLAEPATTGAAETAPAGKVAPPAATAAPKATPKATVVRKAAAAPAPAQVVEEDPDEKAMRELQEKIAAKKKAAAPIAPAATIVKAAAKAPVVAEVATGDSELDDFLKGLDENAAGE